LTLSRHSALSTLGFLRAACLWRANIVSRADEEDDDEDDDDAEEDDEEEGEAEEDQDEDEDEDADGVASTLPALLFLPSGAGAAAAVGAA
jgi:ABC-type Zn2+ transport system substrate-binding protein/surface adhesin